MLNKHGPFEIPFSNQMFIFLHIKVILGTMGLIPVNSFINAQGTQA